MTASAWAPSRVVLDFSEGSKRCGNPPPRSVAAASLVDRLLGAGHRGQFIIGCLGGDGGFLLRLSALACVILCPQLRVLLRLLEAIAFSALLIVVRLECHAGCVLPG